ncbi:MAG: hypothetical protein IT426_11730 [Pirellulales bacterium]|nr:hypothetical protein [Pirellulales bacterium]
MTHEEFSDLIHSEQAKRDAKTDSAEYWQIVWECLNLAESQLPIPRNSKKACLAKQRKLPAGMNAEGKWDTDQ